MGRLTMRPSITMRGGVARPLLSAVLLFVTSGAACRDFLGSSEAGPGRIVWRIPVHSEIGAWHGQPVLVGDLAYFDINNAITAVNVRSGTIAWSTVVRQEMHPIARNIVASRGLVFAAGEDEILALEAASGSIRWRARPDTQIYARSAVDERALYIGTKGPHVVALSLESGQQLWKLNIGPDWEFGGGVSALAVEGDTLFVTGRHNLTYVGVRRTIIVLALDRRTGEEFWRYESPADKVQDTYDAPAITEKLLLISDSMGRTFFAIERATGKFVWSAAAGGYYSGPTGKPVVVGNTVYVGSADTHVYAADLQTGKVLWQTSTEASINNVVVCRDKIFAQRFAVAVLDRHSGKLLGMHLKSWTDFITSGLVVKDRKVIGVGTEGIYAFSC